MLLRTVLVCLVFDLLRNVYLVLRSMGSDYALMVFAVYDISFPVSNPRFIDKNG
jgi:hypothetical protein